MTKMVSYIFGETSDGGIKVIKKAFKKQARFNSCFEVFALVITAYVISTEMHRYGQDKKIKKLSDAIEGLERKKGE